MPFSVKNWLNGQTLDAIGLKDIETRLSNYSAIEVINTVVGAGTVRTLPDPTTQSISVYTLNVANCTFTFPTAVAGTSFTVVVKQDATGNRTVTWAPSVRWPGSVVPVLTTTANRNDVFSFLCVDGSTWYGFTSGKDIS